MTVGCGVVKATLVISQTQFLNKDNWRIGGNGIWKQ